MHGIHGASGPAKVSEQGQSRWSLRTGFNHAAGNLSAAVSSPIAGPLAAWIPPSSPQGRGHGVSCERRGHRALHRLASE
ncbi:hypothetical protein XdyCFBP7245_14260 [Xanthomonas dyei]|uniref:Uncharacterized protein n=1 Tax=Xanthomonas dyei TaxID=743699 RepID=A0A2S7C110_9XANT|nr:hypothetical protein XdyCFBP7245_14260 [Xanthomonas dyei]